MIQRDTLFLGIFIHCHLSPKPMFVLWRTICQKNIKWQKTWMVCTPKLIATTDHQINNYNLILTSELNKSTAENQWISKLRIVYCSRGVSTIIIWYGYFCMSQTFHFCRLLPPFAPFVLFMFYLFNFCTNLNSFCMTPKIIF